MSVDHCDDAISGMDSSDCGAGVRVVVDSRHAGVGSCRCHVAAGGPGCPTESRVVAHYCHLAASGSHGLPVPVRRRCVFEGRCGLYVASGNGSYGHHEVYRGAQNCLCI